MALFGGSRRERGVTTLEYLGVLMAAMVLVGAVASVLPDIRETVGTRLTCAIGGSCAPSSPGAPGGVGGPGAGDVPAIRGPEDGGPTTGGEPGAKDDGGPGMPAIRGPEDGGPTTGHEPGTK